MRFWRLLAAFVLAVLVAEILAALASTQFVLGELARLGVEIPFGDRLSMSVYDIVGMLPLYGTVIGVAFLIALPVAWLLAKRAPAMRGLLFFAAGFVALVTAINIMDAAFGIMPIAGARTLAGLLTQGLAGGLAALVVLLPSFGISRG